jgi:hypothetical protein
MGFSEQSSSYSNDRKLLDELKTFTCRKTLLEEVISASNNISSILGTSVPDTQLKSASHLRKPTDPLYFSVLHTNLFILATGYH